MSQPSTLFDGQGLKDILRGMLRRKIVIAVPLILSLVGGAAVLKLIDPRYLSESQIMIESQATALDRTGSTNDPANNNNLVSDRVVASQVSAMKSVDVMNRVVDALALEKNPYYNTGLKQHGLLSTLAVVLGFKDDPALYTPKALAARRLGTDVTVYQVTESNVIGVKSISSDPEASAATANAIAEIYVTSTQEASAAANTRVKDWIGEQINGLRQRVADSDAAVEDYRSKNGLVRGTTGTLTAEQLSQMSQQLSQAEANRAAIAAKYEEAKRIANSNGDIDGLSDALASPILQRLKDQQTTAKTTLTQLTVTYLPNHPKVVAAQQQLDTINRQIRVEALKVSDSLRSQALAEDKRVASISSDLEELKSSQNKSGSADVQLKALEREAEANRTLLQSMLARYADASGRLDSKSQPAFARIIQRAITPPVPYFPKAGPIMAFFLAAGAMTGFGLAFILELLALPRAPAPAGSLSPVMAEKRMNTMLGKAADQSNGRSHADQLVAGMAVPHAANAVAIAAAAPKPVQPAESAHPILGMIPAAATAAGAANLVASLGRSEGSLLAKAADELAAQILGLKTGFDYSAYAFASLGSTAPNTGLAALAAGRSLASQGHKVAVIDLVGGQGGVEKLLGAASGPGMAELLGGSTDYANIVCRDASSAMSFIRAGDSLSQELLTEKLSSIIAALKSVYAFVLVVFGEANGAMLPQLQKLDATIMLASPARMKDAASAAKAMDASGNTRTLLLRLQPDAQPVRASA